MSGGDAIVGPDLDTMLDVLANKYRRRVLVALLEHNPRTITTHRSPTTSPSEQGTLMISMRHTHLPKLEEAGFIEWDRETNVVRKGPQFEEIRPLLELMEAHADELPDD